MRCCGVGYTVPVFCSQYVHVCSTDNYPPPPLPRLPPHSGDSGDLPDLSELLLRRHSHSATSSPARVRPSATLGASPFSGSGGGGVRSSYHRELSGGSHGGGVEDASEVLTRLSSRSVLGGLRRTPRALALRPSPPIEGPRPPPGIECPQNVPPHKPAASARLACT